MHILVISPTPTFPADQGNRQRVRNVCKALQERGAKIHFAYFPREWGGNFSLREHENMASEWDFFDTIIPSKPFVYQTDGRHFGIDDWWDDAIGRFVRYKCNGMAFDACIVNYAFLSKAFEHLHPNVIRILDTHDRLGGRREMLESHGVAAEFFYTTDEQEKIALDRADLVFAINPEEAATFRAMTSKPVITLGHIVGHQVAPTKERASPTTYRMGFLGSSNSVNVKNMNDFFSAVAVQAPEGIPGIEFEIYGGCCPRIQIPREISRHVKVRGRIEDVAEFYSNVDCVFVPFLFGTGQKIKLIEALSFGKPLIATASASKGSGSTCATHLLESFGEVMHAMRRFATDKRFRNTLRKATAQEFANYLTTIETAGDCVLQFASLNSMKTSLDRQAVAKFFSGQTPAEIINSVARISAVLDLLHAAGSLHDKSAVVDTLLAGISDAKVRRIDVEPPLVDEGATQTGVTQVIFPGLSRESDTTAQVSQLHIYLSENSKAFSANATRAPQLYVDCRPPAPAAVATEAPLTQTYAVRTPTNAPEKLEFYRFQQLLVLCETLDDPELGEHLAAVTTEMSLRTDHKLIIACIDRQGRRAHLNRDALNIEDSDRDAIETINRCRTMALGKPSIALAWGFTHSTADALHRILINDCGPIISYVSRPATPIDGEVLVRSIREAAVWVAHFATAPLLSNDIALRTRMSASTNEGLSAIARRLQETIVPSKRRRVMDQLSALALRETTQHAKIDDRLSASLETPIAT